MNEFTGDFYKCLKCKHVWDWNDTCCPECSGDFEDVNIHEELDQAKLEVERISNMIKAHDA